jgi:hypothetical protein
MMSERQVKVNFFSSIGRNKIWIDLSRLMSLIFNNDFDTLQIKNDELLNLCAK